MTERYELIFLDYSMPLMDGPEFAVLARQLLDRENIVQPYICCCTSYTSSAFYDKAFEAGMDQYQKKPLSYEGITNITGEILGKGAQLQALHLRSEGSLSQIQI